MYIATIKLYINHDNMQVTIGGILRGSGRQYLAAVINFFCYTTLGLPVGIALAFKTSLGTIGLWSGLAGGNIIQVNKNMN